jgi:hypothetical protein
MRLEAIGAPMMPSPRNPTFPVNSTPDAAAAAAQDTVVRRRDSARPPGSSAAALAERNAAAAMALVGFVRARGSKGRRRRIRAEGQREEATCARASGGLPGFCYCGLGPPEGVGGGGCSVLAIWQFGYE